MRALDYVLNHAYIYSEFAWKCLYDWDNAAVGED